MKKFTLDQQVKFRLDGRVEGEGRVKVIFSHSIEVELTKPCKEFDAGCMIIVSHSEVVD